MTRRRGTRGEGKEIGMTSSGPRRAGKDVAVDLETAEKSSVVDTERVAGAGAVPVVYMMSTHVRFLAAAARIEPERDRSCMYFGIQGARKLREVSEERSPA